MLRGGWCPLVIFGKIPGEDGLLRPSGLGTFSSELISGALSLYWQRLVCSPGDTATVLDIDLDVRVGTRLLRFLSQLILSVLGRFVLQPTGLGLDGSCVYHV
jgi:hypothetical protein